MPDKRICLIELVAITFLAIGIASAQTGNRKSTIELTGFQMTVTNDIKVNQEEILDGIRKAALDGSDFLVTPEGSLSGYTSNFSQIDLAIALEEIIAEARKLKVGLILGTCYKEFIRGKEFCYNQVRVYGPDGLFMGTYSKVLRCSSLNIPGSGEMADYVEGELMTFDWNGTRFARF
jgi:predicted amidohydrolase